MDKMRCRLDDTLIKLIRQMFEQTGESTSRSRTTMMSLFFGVLQVRAVEFTLQNNSVREARAKSLLKQAIVVFDNQLGFLCTQSSLDFKTILNSQRMQFVHRQAPVIRTNVVSPIRMEVPTSDKTNPGDDENENAAIETGSSFTSGENGITEPDLTEKEDIVVDTQSDSHDTYANAEITDEPPELEREDACRCIQRVVRRKNLVRQQKQHFKADDYEPGLIHSIQTSTQLVTEEEPKLGVVTKPPPISSTVENSNPLTPSPRKSNMGILSPIMILNPDSDFVGEIRGGINKLMSPLSRILS